MREGKVGGAGPSIFLASLGEQVPCVGDDGLSPKSLPDSSQP